MSLQKLPVELLLEITEKCSFEEKLSLQCNREYTQTLRAVEKNITVFFDGSGTSITNIFSRCDSIGKVLVESRNLDLFFQLFGGNGIQVQVS